jgi:hypothetical protein
MAELSQAQKETLFVWTVLTTNRSLVTDARPSVGQVKAALGPLKIDPTPLIAEVLKNRSAMNITRSVFQDEGINASVQDTGGGGGVIGVEPQWGSDGSHPSIAVARAPFALDPM